MSVDREEVGRIAELARLRLEDDEIDRLTGDMNRILGYADRLRGYAAGGKQAEKGGAGGEGGEGREDASEMPDPLSSGPESFAPRFEEGFFVVPPPPGVTA